MDMTGLGFAVGSACCCISVFLVAIVALSLAFRPRKPKQAELAGVAPAPVRGVQTSASLTRLEAGMPEDVSSTSILSVDTRPGGPARGGNVLPGGPKPPDPTATIPPPAANPRVVAPSPTVTPGGAPPKKG